MLEDEEELFSFLKTSLHLECSSLKLKEGKKQGGGGGGGGAACVVYF